VASRSPREPDGPRLDVIVGPQRARPGGLSLGVGPVGTMPNVLTGRIGLSPAMIGRTGALHRLRSIIDQADEQCSDLPMVVLVGGEAGIGKTRLVREVLDALRRERHDDVVVYTGAAEPGSLSRSFDLVAQLAPAGSTQPAADALAAITAAAAPTDGDARTVVVVVEDLHWVDAESAGFLDDLARRLLPPVVIVGTYRSGDLRRGSPGGDLVSRLERRNEVEQIRLERLDRRSPQPRCRRVRWSRSPGAAVACRSSWRS
jgi:hypothetical protein